MVAGNVTLHDATGTVSGAAISDFLDFRRIYFVPVTTEPDRWTFLNGDLVHPVKGPRDAGRRLLLSEHRRTPEHYRDRRDRRHQDVRAIRQCPNVLLRRRRAAGVVRRQLLVESILRAEHALRRERRPYLERGREHRTRSPRFTCATIPTYKTYLSVEQHLVGDHDYAIFSVNPATRAEKWWNLALYEKLGSRFQIQSFTQYYTQQNWLNLPQAAQQTTYINATYAFPHSYVTATSQLTNFNTLGPGRSKCLSRSPAASTTRRSCRSPRRAFRTRSPSLPHLRADLRRLRLQSRHGRRQPISQRLSQRLAPGRLAIRADSDAGLTGLRRPLHGPALEVLHLLLPRLHHDLEHGSRLQPLHGVIKLNQPASPYETYYFNASYNKQYQWNSLPHWISTDSENFSISRQFSRFA